MVSDIKIITKGVNSMKIKVVKSYKPGIYIRHQVIFNGWWSDITGFLFWPCKGPRKWGGLARIRLVAAPSQPPTTYYRHDMATAKPHQVDYNPLTH